MVIKQYRLFFFLVFGIFFGGCEYGTSPLSTNLINVSQTPRVADEKVSAGNSRSSSSDLLDDSITYLGCWSSGNGNFLKVTRSTIQTKNSYRKLKYEFVAIASADNKSFIKLLEKDESRELPPFLMIEMFSGSEMVITLYESQAAYERGDPIGKMSPWFKDDCSTVNGFLH